MQPQRGIAATKKGAEKTAFLLQNGVCSCPVPKENAMKTLSRFVSKFTSLVVAVLSCFDRVIFKGHLALAGPCELEYFVDRFLKVRRSDFMKTMAPQYSDRLVAHARNWAEKAGRNY